MKLTKRKDGRWMYNYSPGEGQKTKPFYSSEETEAKAEKEILRKIAEYTQKEHKDKHNFKTIAERMLAEKEKEIGFKTWETYSIALKHLSQFNEMNIEDITPSMLDNLFKKMYNKKYSHSSISKVKVVFGLVMNYAIVNDDLPLINFTKEIKVPKKAPKRKIKAPDDYIINKIIENAEIIEFGMWAMIELCTGMRRGEIAAVQIKKIDFEKWEIDIQNSVEFIGNSPYVKETPKTITSIAKVPILDLLKNPLIRLCEGRNPEEFLFGGNKPLTLTQIKKRWDKYWKTIGTKFNQHQLRHAYAKLLYVSGVDPKTMQALLRHADFSTTMNIYTEFVEEMNRKSVTKINDYMNSEYKVVSLLSNERKSS